MTSASSLGYSFRNRSTGWSFAWAWFLGFGLTVYLGLEGGGFDPLVSDQAGIAVWWILLATVAIGALPRRSPGKLAWCALGIFAAFVLWTALSLTWTESTEKTAADLARVLTYLGVFGLGLASRDRGQARQMAGAIGAAVAVLAVIALLSRLHPGWFPSSEQTGNFLATGKERLSYPLNYWNALAALIAIGAPLILWAATDARALVLRALSAAVFPALMLTALFTLSRGGIAAIAIAVAIFIALSPDRLPRLLTLAVAGAGGAVLVALAANRSALLHGHINGAMGHHQASQMLAYTIVVCVIVGLAQAGITQALRHGRPGWTTVSRQQSQVIVGTGIAVLIVALLALGAPSRLSHAWSDFKQPSSGPGHGAGRLSSIAGESRYQFWSSAYREFESKPLTGTGSDTFQLWWTRDGNDPEPIIDTHNLYLQTLGELGLVGAALLLAFIGVALFAGAGRALRVPVERRAALAAVAAGASPLWLTSIFDWTWKVPVLPVASLLLLAVLVTARATEAQLEPVAEAEPRRRTGLAPPLRVAVALVAVATIVAIAIPLASEALVRQSQSAASSGDLQTALDDARSAQNVEPGAAGPRLQQALVMETAGELRPASEAATAATERESTNWRTWLVLARIEAQRGNADAAVAAYRRARSLNPQNEIFAQ